MKAKSRLTRAEEWIITSHARGAAHRQIARDLNDTQQRTPSGALWTHQQVTRVIEKRAKRVKGALKVEADRLAEIEKRRELEAQMTPEERKVRLIIKMPTFASDELVNGGDPTADPETRDDAEQRWQRAAELRRNTPKDWETRSGGWGILGEPPSRPTMEEVDERHKPWRTRQYAGGDEWRKYLTPAVADLIEIRMKGVHDVLDSMTGDPEQRRQLRNLMRGLGREMGYLIETIRAKAAREKPATTLTITDARQPRLFEEPMPQHLLDWARWNEEHREEA